MLRDIVEKPIIMKPFFSVEATSLLTKLLERDPSKRLGCSQAGAVELKSHPFFADLNWDDIKNKAHQTEYKPKVKSAEDTSCIDKLFTKESL
jgi:serine/threonine protein kinase